MGGNGFSMPNIPKFAMGGWSGGGFIDVGERGPERMFVPSGTQVTPNHALRSGGQVVVNVQTNANPLAIGRELDWVMRTAGR